jgi:hypothetical protein
LQDEVERLRAEAAAPQHLPASVTRSLIESREALSELARNLAEQEATNAALKAECSALRSTADTASNAAHGAMLAALRAQSAHSPEGGSLSPPLSARTLRVLQSGDDALARRNSFFVGQRSGIHPAGVGSYHGETTGFSSAHHIALGATASGAASMHSVEKLRSAIATKDALIASLRSECLQLGSQVAALQVSACRECNLSPGRGPLAAPVGWQVHWHRRRTRSRHCRPVG